MSLLQAYLQNPRTRRALSRRPGEKGFSLIELVVVIAVLAVLTAIALPNFLGVSDDAAVRAAQQGVITAFKECQVQKARGNVSVTAAFVPVDLNDFTIFSLVNTTLTPAAAVPAIVPPPAGSPAGTLPTGGASATCFTADTATGVLSMNNFYAVPTETAKFPKFGVASTGTKDCVSGDAATPAYTDTHNVGCTGTGGAAGEYGAAAGAWR